MASVLSDPAKARAKAQAVHSYLTQELQLNIGRKAASVETFAAFMGMMRSCNPLHPRPKAQKQLPVICPLVQRFPEVLTGKLTWYKDVAVALSDVVDFGGAALDASKMWRMMVWIWLGNGGNLHQAWNILKEFPCVKEYKADDLRQPLEVIRFVIHAVKHCGNLMKVIGSDGLDKKSRLAAKRILYLVEWHKAVPLLVQTFHEGAGSFEATLLGLPGLRGDLTRKEILILFAASRHQKLSAVGKPSLPFGQGAKNGAKAFLAIPQMDGRCATHHYHKHLTKMIPEMESAMSRLFPALKATGDHTLTMGDIEPCLCAASVFASLVGTLRKQCPHRVARHRVAGNADKVWEALDGMRGPAGFYAYTREGKPASGPAEVNVPRVSYKRLCLAEVPPRSFLNKKAMFGSRWHVGTVRKRQRTR
ncbi:unnamed protein product [Polarella glacialis]|uniref:Uncharacterized protein n=1 Tax=Polarella glacialis TaxID=89957 RepID=A0A813F5H6_POLGL|nr:unnamed protein product [Polarella glacialis]